MSLEKEKKVNQKVWVSELLKKEHQDEMSKILKFWEKYKEEWKRLERGFWQKKNRKKFVNLIQNYKRNKEKYRRWFEELLSSEEKEILDGLSDIAKDKFYEEYLYEKILYSWSEVEEIWTLNIWAYGEMWDEWWIIDVKQDLQPWVEIDLGLNGLWYEWTKVLAREWKDSLQPWMYIDLAENEIWDKWIEIIAREWKDKLQPWMEIRLWFNEICDKWAEVLAKEWKDRLQPGMSINLCYNEIWDEWAEALAKEWKDSLQPWMEIVLAYNKIWKEWVEALVQEWKDSLQPGIKIDLWSNKIWDEWIKILAEMWKDSLQPWMTINLSDSGIWDEWAQIIMDNWELKEWMKIYLEYNDISEQKKKELKAWGQQYKDSLIMV